MTDHPPTSIASLGVLERVREPCMALDREWRFTFLNAAAVEVIGRPAEELLGKNIWVEFPHHVERALHGAFHRAMAEQLPLQIEELDPRRDRWFESRIHPSPDGLTIFFQDVTVRKRSERLTSAQQGVCEAIVAGAPLADTLERLVERLEPESSDTTLSVVLRVEVGQRRQIAARDLPDAFVDAIDRTLRAVRTRAPGIEGVIVVDIAADPSWAGARAAAERQGVRACWLRPLLGTDGRALGACAVYHAAVRAPNAHEHRFLEHLARLAQLAVESSTAERERRSNEDRMHLLSRGGSIGFIDVDLEESRTYRSPSLLAMTGRDPITASGEGEDAWNDLHPEDRARVMAEVWRTDDAPPTFTTQYRIACADGSYRWFEQHAMRSRAANGRVHRVVAVIHDVTEKKHNEDLVRRSEERYRSLAEATAQVVWTCDSDGASNEDNPLWRAFTGQTTEEFLGHGWLHAIHPDDRPRAHESIGRDLAAGVPFEMELRFRRRDGEWRDMQVRGVPVRVGDAVREWVGVLNDVTEANRAEADLHALNRDLELRVAARTEELRRANETLAEQNRRVEEATRLKSVFIANMSHELRTPLNAIIGFSELLYDRKVGPVTEQQAACLRDILGSGRHLLEIINSVLDLAKIEAGKMDFRPTHFDLRDVVTGACHALRPLSEAKHIDVAFDIDPSVCDVVLDPSRLKQVLVNYVSNALKFTPEHGHVVVRARAEGAEAVRLEVSDTGIGVGPDDREKLFREFVQLDDGTGKQYPGTGLGLALVKHIVEAQGGRVGVESAPGGGSTFFAVLPRAAAEVA